MLVKAYAKLNLYLCVKRKIKKLHEIVSLFQNIQLHDTIFIDKKYGNIEYEGPDFKDNIIFKALKALGIKRGISIKMKKMIPVQAGLGGGSSDAAAVLCSVNELFNLGINEKELIEIAATIGSDVPFFIKGGTCRVSKTGENIEKLSPLKGIKVAVFVPEHSVSTKEAYEKLDTAPIKCKGNLKELYRNLKDRDFDKIAENAFNSFDELFSNEKWSQESKKILCKVGGMSPMLTGSGSAFFAYLHENVTLKNNTIIQTSFTDKGYEIDV